ncbi:MAG: YigZ family protein [Thiopseudomonas sp.]|nr:YigZ family protein [Thiopseudomonas sp.]
MSAPSGLRRLLAPVQHRVEIRKSRFLAQAVVLGQPEAAAALLAQVSDFSASHNCWAWRCGPHYRFSDDGEPGGTAGRPILSAIEHQGFDQCLLVVTRWYGGIQLGTGGLARAYGGSANSCLQGAASEPLVERTLLQCLCPYALLEQFKTLLAAADGCIMDERFLAAGVHLHVGVPVHQHAQLQQRLQNLSRGEVVLTRTDSSDYA